MTYPMNLAAALDSAAREESARRRSLRETGGARLASTRLTVGAAFVAIGERLMPDRAERPQARAAVFSGYSNDPVFTAYRRFGFVGAIKKPFRIGEFKAFIRHLLNGSTDQETSQAAQPAKD